MSTPQLTSIAAAVASNLGFKNISFCGKGSFKETFRAEKADGSFVALKLVDRTKIDVSRTAREIHALMRCSSNRIAKILHSCEFTAPPPDGRTFDVVIEEFFDGGSLEDSLKLAPFTQRQAIDLGVGLLLAIRDLKPLFLIHRDIKPANIMFRKGFAEPVLVDFGIVRDLSQTSLTATWAANGPGTPLFASPEQLNNDKAMIDWRSDQFSIGVVVGFLLWGKHPYQTDLTNPQSAIHAVVNRAGPTTEFRDEMIKKNLSAVYSMVRAWPAQRFLDPDEAINALKPPNP